MKAMESLAAEIKAFMHRLGMNSFWLMLTRLGSQVLSALTIILVARALGPAGLGGFTFITSLILVANVFTTFGLDTLLVRELARSRDHHSPYLPAALWLQLGFSLIIIMGLWLTSGWLTQQEPGTKLAIQIYSLVLLPLAYYTVYSAVLRAYERMELFLLVNFIVVAAQAAGAWLILNLGGNLVSLSIVLVVSQVLGAIAAQKLSTWAVPGITLIERPPLPLILLIQKVLRHSWLLALLGGLAAISQHLGVLTLSLIAGQAMTGTFSAANRLIELLKLGHYAYFGALFPVLAAQADGSNFLKPGSQQQISWRLVRLSFASLLLLSIGAVIALNWSASPLITLLYGPGYGPSAKLLKLLAWRLVPYTINAQLSLEMVTRRQEGYVVSSSAISISLAAIAYITLVPSLGLNGAGLAAVIGETVNATLLVFFSLRTKVKNVSFLPIDKRIPFRDEIRRGTHTP